MKHKRMLWTLVGLLLAALISSSSNSSPITQAQGGGMLAYGAKVQGSIAADTPLVVYSFTGSAGDVVAASVDNWTGTLDVHAELVAPGGVLLGSSTQNLLADNPMGAYLAAVLPNEGLYLVVITGDHGTTGDFLLTLHGRNAMPTTQLLFRQAVQVTIPAEATSQYFAFEAQDCPTTLVITNPGQGQPFTFPFLARVRDQRGQLVSLLRGGQQTEDWVTVAPRSGWYEVEIWAADPALAGVLELLVTCAEDVPGCVAGQPPAAGLVAEACAPCPDPDELVPGGGCPDLNFVAQRTPGALSMVTVTWDMMPDAEGYSVYVYGLVEGGGEVYLTHANWIPGNPTAFSWDLPAAGYTGFRFVLRVYIGDEIICTAEASLGIESRPVCAEFTVWIVNQTENSVSFEWSEYPGADGYVLSVLGAVTRTILPGWPVVVSASQHSYTVTDPPVESFIFTVGPWNDETGGFCMVELAAEVQEIPRQSQYPCLIRAEHASVAARVGPSVDRSIFAWLTAGQEYPVLGTAHDAEGAVWWQIDKTLFAGHEMVLSLWVAAADVTAIGACDNVPPADVPPVIPWEPEQPQPGGWLPCGSCDTCGHPASECVTSPAGACLWDPASCSGDIPPDDGSGCYAVSAAIDMGRCFGPGSAMLDTPPNCGSRYTPGTTISAHAVAVDPKCNVEYWSGCGASGSDNNITFTPGASCVITAHMHYGN